MQAQREGVREEVKLPRESRTIHVEAVCKAKQNEAISERILHDFCFVFCFSGDSWIIAQKVCSKKAVIHNFTNKK